jgi:hypothetical protein
VSLSNMLRGISGEFEINRVLGACGVAAYIVTTPSLVAWEVLHEGKGFDLVAFCAAFPTGLGVAIGAIAGAVSLKDRNVATAMQTRDATNPSAAPSSHAQE